MGCSLLELWRQWNILNSTSQEENEDLETYSLRIKEHVGNLLLVQPLSSAVDIISIGAILSGMINHETRQQALNQNWQFDKFFPMTDLDEDEAENPFFPEFFEEPIKSEVTVEEQVKEEEEVKEEEVVKEEVADEEENEQTLICDWCNKRDFRDGNRLRQHLTNRCLVCHLCFHTQKLLRTHDKEIHNVKVNQCKVCRKQLSSPKCYDNHMKAYHDTNADNLIHKCQFCELAFNQENRLRLHYAKMHRDKNPFKCSACPREFFYERELRNHVLRVHEKKFETMCHICSQGFHYAAQLNDHISKVHDKVKNRKCPKCDFKGYTSKEIRRHILRVHENITHICEYCGRSFHTRSVMLKHVKALHTRELNVKCNLCPKAYLSQYYLTRHMAEAHEGFKQPCRVCNQMIAGFGTGNMRKHLRAVHKVDR